MILFFIIVYGTQQILKITPAACKEGDITHYRQVLEDKLFATNPDNIECFCRLNNLAINLSKYSGICLKTYWKQIVWMLFLIISGIFIFTTNQELKRYIKKIAKFVKMKNQVYMKFN